MGSLPADIEIVDTRTDEGDWRFKALVPFPDEVIVLDLRIHEESDYLPLDAEMIVRQLRSQWPIDNWRSVSDQVRERSSEPVILGFFR